MRAMLTLAALLGALCEPAATQERLHVRPEPGTPVVTAQLLLAVGPADEPEGSEGIAYLTARAAVAPVRPILDSLGAHLAVDVHKDAVTFALTAAPDVWEEASRLLMVAVFRDAVDSTAMVRQRTAIAEELRVREASPADALVRRLDAAVFGEGHPWARPAVGRAAAVRRLGWAEVDGFLRGHFLPGRAVVAVIGPVERPEVEAHLASFLDDGALRLDTAPAAAPVDSVVHVEYNAITAWVGVSYGFGPEADEDALRMLSEAVLGRVSFGPSRRSVYDARAEVIRRAGGSGELRITLVVPPREAALWADRIREAVAGYAATPLAPAQFSEALRRFRGRRLLELDTPEARVAAISRAVLVGSGRNPLGAEHGLTADGLAQAARELHAPVVVLLGPFEGD